MTKTPTYYAWYPAVERSKDIVSILLTRGVNTSAPKGGNEFGSSLLQACGIDVPVVMYSSDEFITSYFSTSRNDWQEAWDVRILLEGKAAARPKPLIRFPVLVAPTEQGQVRTQIPLRVIADFNSRKAAIACRDLLKAAARQQTIHWVDRYATRDVTPRQHQLVADVAMKERADLAQIYKDGEKVMDECMKCGGKTSVAFEMTKEPR